MRRGCHCRRRQILARIGYFFSGRASGGPDNSEASSRLWTHTSFREGPMVRSKISRYAGFTLVELLVVVGIVALLIGLMMPSLSAARIESRRLQCASKLRNVAHALELYASLHNGRYPPNDTTPPGRYWYDGERCGMSLGGAG